jgi:LmbE family N-acetylglucosaminyl deacetylase
VIRTFRPDAVLAVDPTVLISDEGYVQHTDHRAAGIAAIDAVYPASRNAMAFPNLAIDEGLAPHEVNLLYLFWTEHANAWVDVSGTIAVKIAALREHVTQIRKPDELEERIRTGAKEEGERLGVEAVESFRLVDLS